MSCTGRPHLRTQYTQFRKLPAVNKYKYMLRIIRTFAVSRRRQEEARSTLTARGAVCCSCEACRACTASVRAADTIHAVARCGRIGGGGGNTVSATGEAVVAFRTVAGARRAAW